MSATSPTKGPEETTVVQRTPDVATSTFAVQSGVRVANVDERRSVERAMKMGAFVWPAFTLVDLYLGLAVYPGAPVGLFLLFRAIGQVGILTLLSMSRRPTVASRTLELANAFICGSCSLMISIMAVHFGGLSSPYVHGLSIVVLVEALAVPAPVRNTLLYSTPSVLSFPLVLLLGPEHETLAAQLSNPQELLTFGAHYVMVLATVAVAAVSGQIAWNARLDLQRARRIGRYRLEALLGRGGMNEVWLAWDELLRRKVALKILRSVAPEPSAARRFEREALALSRLTSSNTVRIFDFGASDDGFSFIAMEYLPGADLAALVRDHGPLPAQRAVHFALQACRSLAEAHEAGIVHRDIKPANLLAADGLGEPDLLKVLDFGIARSLAADATVTQVVAGTPAYMAPECWWNGPTDARSDVYSLGATLYFLLTGTAPFERRSAASLGSAHVFDRPESPSARRGELLPPRLERLVLRCLEKSPSDRFPSAWALASALEECARELPPWTSEDAAAAWALWSRPHDATRAQA